MAKGDDFDPRRETTPPPPTDNAGAASSYLDVQAGQLISGQAAQVKSVFGAATSQIGKVAGAAAGVAGGFIKNLFRQQPIAPMRGPRAGAFYQVKPGDSLPKIAASTSVPLAQLRDANNGIMSAPPEGSYVALNPAGAGQEFKYNSGNPMAGLRPGANLPASMKPTGPSEVGAMSLIAQNKRIADGLDAFNTSATFDLNPDRSLLPNLITSQQQRMLGIDALTMSQVYGYNQDPGSGTWYSTGGGGGGGKPARDQRGNLIRNPSQVGNRNQRQSDIVNTPMDNAMATPTTVLSLRLGSG